MGEECPKCGKNLKNSSMDVYGEKDLLKITYCPKCEYFESTFPLISIFKGKAQRGVDKKTGEFRLKVISPEEWSKRDILVKTFPRTIVTKKSELRFHGRSARPYVTKERKSLVYPYVKRNDEIVVAGFYKEGIPLTSIIMNNLTIGISSVFIEENIKLSKGFLSTFNITNPIFTEAEKIIQNLMNT